MNKISTRRIAVLAASATLGAALAATSTVSAPGAKADEAFLVCPSGRSGVATSVTSCAFADNVRSGYLRQGEGDVLAYSPVTGKVYGMWCVPGYVSTLDVYPFVTNSVRCTGGDNAVVVLF